jgi:hypothetical protein
MNAFRSSFRQTIERFGPGLLLVLLALAALILVVGLYLGRQLAIGEFQQGKHAATETRSEVSALREALEEARSALQVQRTRHEVDSRALDLVRTEMAAERERMADLEEVLSFYRNMVVSADDMSNGIILRKPEIVPTATAGRFSYRIYVQQKARDYETVQGSLSVEVYGSNSEGEVRYPLGQLSDQFESPRAALEFRYFQVLEGELVLPEGFEPQGFALGARTSKPRKLKASQNFPWDLQERFINVGK